jgi:hypothetical protein
MCSVCSVKWAPIVLDDTVSAIWLRRLLRTRLKLQAICNCRLHVHSVSTCTYDEWHLFCGSTRSAFLCVLCTKCIKWKHRWEVLAVFPVLPPALLSQCLQLLDGFWLRLIWAVYNGSCLANLIFVNISLISNRYSSASKVTECVLDDLDSIPISDAV